MRRRTLGLVQRTRSQEEEIKRLLTQLLECFLCKDLDTTQVLQVQGENVNLVLGRVKVESVEGGLGTLDIASSEDKCVGLGVVEEKLFDGFEAL